MTIQSDMGCGGIELAVVVMFGERSCRLVLSLVGNVLNLLGLSDKKIKI